MPKPIRVIAHVVALAPNKQLQRTVIRRRGVIDTLSITPRLECSSEQSSDKDRPWSDERKKTEE